MHEPARIVPRYAHDAFGPGDRVEGVLELAAPMDGIRRIDAYLKYLDRSPSYSGAVAHDAVEPLHEGPLTDGQRVPFGLRLPADALPEWRRPITEDMGTLSWGLVLQVDVGGGLDKTITHAVPVVAHPAAWSGPEPGANGEVKASGGGWDATIAPDRWALRRGETVSVEVAIAEPEGGRDSMGIALMCQADYAVEYVTTDSDGDRDARREWRHATLFEDRPPIDPALERQTVSFTIPPEAPWSYDGRAFGFRWFVVAREARRWRSDPHRSARLQVLP